MIGLGRSAVLAAAVLVVGALAACGGGGGGGGGGIAVTWTPSTLEGSFVEGHPTSFPITVQLSSVPEVSVAPVLVDSSAGFGNQSLRASSSDGGHTWSATLTPASGLAARALPYTGTLTLRLMKADGSELGLSGNTLSYSLTVRSTIQASTATVAFAQIYGGPAPEPVRVQLQDGAGASYAWTAAVTSDAQGFLRIGAGTEASGSTLPDTLSLAVAPGVPPGSYTAKVHVSGAGSSVDVLATYTVTAPTLLAPASLSFSVDGATIAGALTRTVTTASSGGALPWTVTSSVPWLGTSAASGSSGDSLTVSIDPTALAALSNGSHDATLTFAYGAAPLTPATVVVPVNLQLGLPTVALVAPRVSIAGAPQEVVIRGSGLTGVQASQVLMCGTPVASLSARSDTELRAVPPALAAGSCPVALQNALGVPRASGTLAVVPAPTFAAATIEYPAGTSGAPAALQYDPERKAILVALSSSTVLRYPFAQVGWDSPTVRTTADLTDLALALDGSTILEVGRLGVRQLDPVTLATQRVTNAPFDSFYYLTHLALANDGRAIVLTGLNGSGFTSGYYYSVADATLTAMPRSYYFGAAAASANGARVLIASNGVSPVQAIQAYDAGAGTFTSLPVSANTSRLALDRTASRAIIGSTVYDGGFTALGTLPSSTQASALSPDGSRVYTLDLASTDAAVKLRTFTIGTSGLAEVGTAIALAGNPGTQPRMVVSPDGGTVFIAGSSRLVVQPAP